MCTLIVAHRHIAGRPLVVAANRDEYLDRPSEGPAIRETRVGRLMAPLDVRAGGTWLGLSDRGVFAALTNLRTESPDPQRRSRGDVVLDALGAASAVESASRLASLEREAYNPFNLLVADEHSAHVVVYREQPQVHALEPGVHVIGNVEAAGPGNEKVRRIRGEVDAAIGLSSGGSGEPQAQDERGESRDTLDRLAAICRRHGDPARIVEASRAGNVAGDGERQESSNDEVGSGGREALDDTCVHLGGTYGTRSSLLLELGAGFETGRLLHADGPPCQAAYQDVSSLLIELGRKPGIDPAESLMRTAS